MMSRMKEVMQKDSCTLFVGLVSMAKCKDWEEDEQLTDSDCIEA